MTIAVDLGHKATKQTNKQTCSLCKESHKNPGRMDSCLVPSEVVCHSNQNAPDNGRQEPSEVVCHSFLLNAQTAIIALT